MASDVNLEDFHGETPYHIMFGPDICGPGTKKVHVIFHYKGRNHMIKKDIRCKVLFCSKFSVFELSVLFVDLSVIGNSVYIDVQSRSYINASRVSTRSLLLCVRVRPR